MRNLSYSVLLTAACSVAGSAALAQVPDGYPEAYQQTIDLATNEGRLLVYSSTDSSSVTALLNAFSARYPGITVDFLDLSSNDVYTRLTSESAAGSGTADLIWAGADTVSQLVEAGYAAEYQTPEAPNLIDGVIWQNSAFGVTIEPITLVYNPRLVDPVSLPDTHEGLIELLGSMEMPGMVATFDPARSAAGLAYGLVDSEEMGEGYWDLISAFGDAGALLYSSTSTMVEKVISGEHTHAYNIAGSTAAANVASSPDSLAIHKFCDHTPHLVRTMMIPANARNVNASKLFLDFTLSPEGQQLLAATPFGVVRDDVVSDPLLAMPEGCGDAVVLMAPGDDRLKTFDETIRSEFIADWHVALEAE